MGKDWKIWPLEDRKAKVSQLARDTETFWRDGFVIMRNVFAPAEIALLKQAILDNVQMSNRAAQVQKKYLEGKYPSFETIYVWNDTSGDDIFARFTRRARIFDTLESIFEDQPYVYHNKVALKYADMPGFKFHQDYFYWYHMGCLRPELATCYIAIDPATRENGCLKLIERSHELGRIDHVFNDGISDSEADPARLEIIGQRMPVHHIELDPGDCVLFHCCTLHGSDVNRSEQSRLALLGCYNIRRNDPFLSKSGHPNFIQQSRFRDPITEADARKWPDFAKSYADAE